MADFKLHCFAQSGNAYKVAMMLDLTGSAWEPVFVDYFVGQTRDPAWRAEVSEMGEVPVLEHRGERLTQSGMILDALAEITGRFGGRDARERREIWRWILFDNHKFTSYFATHRWLRTFAEPKGHPEVMAFLAGRISNNLGIVERHLKDRPFLLGDRPTIADLSLAGYLFYPVEETGYDLDTTHPAIAAWADRISELPGWRAPYEAMPARAAVAA
ncbi:glutathione S-transferase family protein [Prosthecomicrobium sp. N25]|uniref:glutathione S-transferase family protein n=1 Tax=Prosthecomicrobium sp. N25 TaxID=3129254 RepID=UPI0030789071